MFGTKKSQTQPEPVETIAAQEHKQSIGNQVMEALGVGENGTGLDVSAAKHRLSVPYLDYDRLVQARYRSGGQRLP